MNQILGTFKDIVKKKPKMPYHNNQQIPTQYKGYKFSIDAGMDDYGHILPVKLRKIVSRHNIHIDGYIRETLKCRSRFWKINKCGDEIQKILSMLEFIVS